MALHQVLLQLQHLGVFFIAFDRGQELVSALSIVTAGATIGFLNVEQIASKDLHGRCRCIVLGHHYFCGNDSFESRITPTWHSLAIPVMLLAVPLLDTCVAVFSRLARGCHH
jgi:UDP-GlcNAc:undecaprenyl-phosphate/decaprenyl-phosphate GlcNAc-1-phosphate transferase